MLINCAWSFTDHGLSSLALRSSNAGAQKFTRAVPKSAIDRGRRSLSALRGGRSFRWEGAFRDFVEEHAVPAACQIPGDALRDGLVGEGTDPDPLITNGVSL